MRLNYVFNQDTQFGFFTYSSVGFQKFDKISSSDTVGLVTGVVVGVAIGPTSVNIRGTATVPIQRVL